MATIGWIKLHRKILDNPIMANEGLLQLFIYCLLSAGHKESRFLWNGEEIVLEAGSFITGRKKISKELNVKERTVYDRLKILQSLKMILLKSNNKFTVVKVLNYPNYQGSNGEAQQQANNKPTTNQQRSNTNKNKDNYMNEDNYKYGQTEVVVDVIEPEIGIKFDDFWTIFPKRVAKIKAIRAWKKIKPVEHDALLDALRKAVNSSEWRKDGGKYIPNPATWLNDRRWEDEYSEPVKEISYIEQERENRRKVMNELAKRNGRQDARESCFKLPWN